MKKLKNEKEEIKNLEELASYLALDKKEAVNNFRASAPLLDGKALSSSELAGKGTASPSSVSSAAPKQFNINIEKLVEKLEVVSNTVTEGATEIKEQITQALLEAVADVELSR